MKQTQGRFLLQPNRDFPADCEMLDYIQTNAHIVSIIGNLAGDKAVLLGCEPLNETQRGEGYVFLRTKDHPEGEVLFWEGGSTSGGMYLKQETISVQAHGYDYPEAYVRRSLAAGVGSEAAEAFPSKNRTSHRIRPFFPENLINLLKISRISAFLDVL